MMMVWMRVENFFNSRGGWGNSIRCDDGVYCIGYSVKFRRRRFVFFYEFVEEWIMVFLFFVDGKIVVFELCDSIFCFDFFMCDNKFDKFGLDSFFMF